MITTAIRTAWSEPRAPSPPARVWRDWVLVGLLIPAAVVETLVRDAIVWKPLTLALSAGLLLTLLWRRTHPLLMLAIAFGTTTVMTLAGMAADVDWQAPAATAGLILLPYALLRWGSGREVLLGLPVMLAPVVVSVFSSTSPAEEVIGGTILLLLVSAVGAAVRFQISSRRRALEAAALREREQIARELHDTVAHHVSAIAIQAQGGRALGAVRPEAALGALEVIEEEASRTLTEMRTMVAALRRDEVPELAPGHGVADVERLAGDGAGGPPVHVELTGDLDGLRPSLDAALYRLAQESITNAVRHARGATRIEVRIAGDPDAVRLTVHDDGRPAPAGAPGYGLAGMRERAALLGGSLRAGAAPGGGWTVQAVLPRGGGPA